MARAFGAPILTVPGIVAVAVLLIPPGVLHGQSLVWAGYGRDSDDASRLSTGESLTVGYGLFRPHLGLTAMVGLPVDAAASSRWVTAGGWFERNLPGPLEVVGSGTLFGFDDPVLEATGTGSAFALDVAAAFRTGPVGLRIGGGGRHGIHASGGERSTRLLGRAGGGGTLEAGPVRAGADLDHWRAEEDGYTRLAARIGVSTARLGAWAGAARWLDEGLPGTGWDVGVRVPVTDRVAVTARGGVQTADILFWIPRQRTWSLAVQLRTGAAATGGVASALDVLPAAVLHDSRTAVVLSLPDLAGTGLTGQPGVAGSFSDWRVLPMEPAGTGWRIELSLEPGVHEYAFVTTDGVWFVPEGTPGRKPDGFGGHVAVLIVQ